MVPATRPRSRVARNSLATLALVALVLVSILASLAFGTRSIDLSVVIDAVLGRDLSPDAVVVTSQRVPRTIAAVAVGLALGMAGALMQGHTRNPLAEPGLFGVNAGAGFAVAVLAFGFGTTAPIGVVAAALVGAAVAATAVFVLGLGQLRGGSLVMLAVIGTTVSALLAALTSSLVLLDRQTLDVMRFWQVGSLAGRDANYIPIVVGIIMIGALLALVNGFAVNALGLGEDVARSLGIDVRRARIVGLVAITLLAGAATAMCGPLTFIGLVAPHAARLISGQDYRWVVPQSGLISAAILLVADTIGRLVARPGELQVGVVLAIIGAPVLIAITRRRRVTGL